jgi:hypothetical protein
VNILRSARIPLAVGVLGLVFAAIVPASAGEPAACDWARANALNAQGDRYRAHGQFVSAARSYLDASRAVADCRTEGGLMLGARSLAQGGTAVAQSGDLFNGRQILESAQSRLQTIFSLDGQTSAAAHAYSDLVQDVISAIDRIAQSYM